MFLVSSFLESTFNKDTFALRDKTILKVDREKVDGLELPRTARRTLEFAKNGHGLDASSSRSRRAPTSRAVEGALERLASAQMQGIVEPRAPPI